jgi:hypothetical protein
MHPIIKTKARLANARPTGAVIIFSETPGGGSNPDRGGAPKPETGDAHELKTVAGSAQKSRSPLNSNPVALEPRGNLQGQVKIDCFFSWATGIPDCTTGA